MIPVTLGAEMTRRHMGKDFLICSDPRPMVKQDSRIAMIDDLRSWNAGLHMWCLRGSCESGCSWRLSIRRRKVSAAGPADAGTGLM
jgi:hypothetical protein